MDSSPRVPKRAREDVSGGGNFRPANSSSTTAPVMASSRVKLPRLDSSTATSTTATAKKIMPAEDVASVGRSKAPPNGRTGQACDRCKVRKIRCDALPEGCSHCLGQNLECYVTDRITGRTERRGYLQDLERERDAMQRHIRKLQDLLRDQAAVEVLPWTWSPYTPVYPPGVSRDKSGNLVQDTAGGSDSDRDTQWTCSGSVWWRREPGASADTGADPGQAPADSRRTKDSQSPTNASRPLHASSRSMSGPSYLPSSGASSTSTATALLPPYDTAVSSAPLSALRSRPVNSYLGVFADRAPLNSVNGTQVSILGTLLDIDATGPGDHEPTPLESLATGLYNLSLDSFLRTAFKINPPMDNVELPSRSDAFEYSEWFFLMAHPFVPVLHKPTYMALLTRIYDDAKFHPTTSELVIVHMVFAIIYFQYGVRNREELDRQIHLYDLSNKHYHWALGKFYNIASDWSITSVQALILITMYTRSFPKPGCGSTIASFTLTRAIDLGLHRASSMPEERTTLDNEMRKRAWWSALMFAITLNGRLGRPMPIRIEDFDTEMPVAIADEYLTDDGITDPSRIGQVPFHIALYNFELTPLYMEMFSHLYGARRDPDQYAAIVRKLERQHDTIVSRLPRELRLDACPPAAAIYALYAKAVSLEFLLCLHHPSACLTPDPQVYAENTRICEDKARDLLSHVRRLLTLKPLDTTWYQMSVYCAAMFSMLAAAWERRFTATAAEIERLQDEISSWLSIIAEIGLLAGASNTGQPFNRRLTQICAHTVFSILQGMPPTERAAVMQRHTQVAHKPGTVAAAAAVEASHQMGSHQQPYINITRGGGSVRGGKYVSSPGNVDSVACHLETRARIELESRLDRGLHEQHPAVPAAPTATATAATATTATPYRNPKTMTQSAGGPNQFASMAQSSYAPNISMPHTGTSDFEQTPSRRQQQQNGHEVLYVNALGVGASAADTVNPWASWTAAFADISQSHDRFMSTDALIDLNILQQRLAPELVINGGCDVGLTSVVGPVSGPGTGVADQVGQVGQVGQVSQVSQVDQAHVGGVHAQHTDTGGHSAQWPLIVFNEHVLGV